MNPLLHSLKSLYLRALGLVLLVPTTLIAGAYGVILLGITIQDVYGHDELRRADIARTAIVLAGWLGVYTLWRLYYHFRQYNFRPAWAKTAWVGLVLGCATNITLIALAGGSLRVRLLLIGWPLLGAIALGLLLFHALPRDAQAKLPTT